MLQNRSLPVRAVLAIIVALAFVPVIGLASVPGATDPRQYRGAASHMLWRGVSAADYERELALLDRAGANSMRLDLSWSSLESGRKGELSRWYVDKVDKVLAAAADRGVKVILTVWSTPCWASSAPKRLKRGCSGAWWDRAVDRYPPVNASDYADATAYVARRWSKYLAAIELWNEPNGTDAYFLHADDQAAAYATLVKAAYPRIKREAPGLTVLAGALSFSDSDFLERLYAKGIKGYFDGFSVHPYNEWRSPRDAWRPEWRKYTFITGVPWIHSIMDAHGDGNKGLWLTEFGFSNCGSGDRWCVSAAKQAKYVAESFRVAAGWPYVKAAVVYNLRNRDDRPTNRESQFGLVRRDFRPKQAYRAFSRVLRELGTHSSACARAAPRGGERRRRQLGRA